jgi:hypothetical protein
MEHSGPETCHSVEPVLVKRDDCWQGHGRQVLMAMGSTEKQNHCEYRVNVYMRWTTAFQTPTESLFSLHASSEEPSGNTRRYPDNICNHMSQNSTFGSCTRSSSVSGSRSSEIGTACSLAISASVRCFTNTGLPRHLTVTQLPSLMLDRSTSRAAIARTSAEACTNTLGTEHLPQPATRVQIKAD